MYWLIFERNIMSRKFMLHLYCNSNMYNIFFYYVQFILLLCIYFFYYLFIFLGGEGYIIGVIGLLLLVLLCIQSKIKIGLFLRRSRLLLESSL